MLMRGRDVTIEHESGTSAARPEPLVQQAAHHVAAVRPSCIVSAADRSLAES